MSKIGRKPIDLGTVQVELKNNTVFYKGKKGSGEHVLPSALRAHLIDHALKLECLESSRKNNMLWGLHRALLANEIQGIDSGFQEVVNISGLGFKAVLAGKVLTFSLGYSHKIQFPLPEGIDVEVDKTGQNVTIKGKNRQLVGLTASKIRALRPVEPYKATGIKRAGEVVLRKAGKTKAA